MSPSADVNPSALVKVSNEDTDPASLEDQFVAPDAGVVTDGQLTLVNVTDEQGTIQTSDVPDNALIHYLNALVIACGSIPGAYSNVPDVQGTVLMSDVPNDPVTDSHIPDDPDTADEPGVATTVSDVSRDPVPDSDITDEQGTVQLSDVPVNPVTHANGTYETGLRVLSADILIDAIMTHYAQNPGAYSNATGEQGTLRLSGVPDDPVTDSHIPNDPDTADEPGAVATTVSDVSRDPVVDANVTDEPTLNVDSLEQSQHLMTSCLDLSQEACLSSLHEPDSDSAQSDEDESDGSTYDDEYDDDDDENDDDDDGLASSNSRRDDVTVTWKINLSAGRMLMLGVMLGLILSRVADVVIAIAVAVLVPNQGKV